jgi:hypothetical protein
MLDTLTSANHTDFRQRYLGTYGWFHTGGRKLLVYVNEVSDREVVFSDRQGTSYNVFRDSGLEFEFIPVDRGWFNTVNGAVYLARVPARQWHRGICKSNTQIYTPTKEGSFTATGVGIRILSEIFENKVTVKDALDKYVVGSNSVALSKHFAITPAAKFAFYDQLVGTVDHKEGKFTLTLTDNLIHQEVSDLIRRNNYPITLN